MNINRHPWFSRLLAIPEGCYRLLVALDVRRAERRRARGDGPRRLPRPVVSVGNIVAGGSGKTPVVEAFAREWLRRGGRPAILSRGYRAGPHGNDEYQLLCRRLPGIPHVQDPDRFRGGERVLREHPGVDLFLLDDGFQHRALHRDLDVVILDATRPLGYGHLLPRGYRREPWSALRRADHILLTRLDGVSSQKLEILRTFLREQFPRIPVSDVEMISEGLRAADGEVRNDGFPTCVAFAGIGNPRAFFTGLRRQGYEVVDTRSFPDHHSFDEDDLHDLKSWAAERGASALVCTEKDGVKLERLPDFARGSPPIYQLRVHARIADPHPLHLLADPR